MSRAIQYIPAKSIITKSKLPDAEYVVNPYLGCSFGCMYCYAHFMGRRLGYSPGDWGNFVYVKENALAMFSEELATLLRKKETRTLLFSSVTDPYQPIEARLLLTRKMLEMCAALRYGGKVTILTKSPLVIRDIDILARIPFQEVGITITHVDEESGSLLKTMEKNAPKAGDRLRTLEKLNRQGIATYAFIGPLMPHLFQELGQLEGIFKEISCVGTQEVFVEYLNIKPAIKDKILCCLDSDSVLFDFYNTLSSKIKMLEGWDDVIDSFLKKYNLKLRLNRILHHA